MKFKVASENRLVISELIAGIFGTTVVYYVVSLIYMFILRDIKSNTYFIIRIFQPILSASAIILVSSLLVYFVGKFNSQHESYLFTLLGSVLGFCFCFLIVYIIAKFKTFNLGSPNLALISGVVYIIIPSIGAVIAYNLRQNK